MLKKSKCFFTIILCTTFLLSCAAFRPIAGVNDFNAFLSNLSIRIENNDFNVPSVLGFTPIINVSFDFGKPFNGNYTFVSIDGFDLLMRYNGELFRAPQGLLGAEFYNDKFITRRDRGELLAPLFGVRHIFGDILVEPNYYNIKILGSTILVNDAFNRFSVYKNGTRLHYSLQDVALLSENILLKNNAFVCVITLEVLTVDGFYIAGIEQYGISLITCGTYFGFAKNNQVLIKPQFLLAQNFNSFNYAFVRLNCGKYTIIDTQGSIVVKEQNGKRPINFDGEFIVFVDTNYSLMLGIADRYFNPLSHIRFLTLLNTRVFGGNIVIYNAPDMPYRFFMLQQGFFVMGEYASIKAVGDYFVAKSFLGCYTLYDLTLRQVLSNKDFIAFNGIELTVRHMGLTHFYRQI